jgi:hypothetical protein
VSTPKDSTLQTKKLTGKTFKHEKIEKKVINEKKIYTSNLCSEKEEIIFQKKDNFDQNKQTATDKKHKPEF